MARPAPGARAVSGARPTAGGTRTAVRSPYAPPASSGFSSGAAPTDRPSRPARPERIRPTAAMQRGDVNDPWARPDTRNATRPAGTHHARPTSGETSKPYVRQERADRGEELSTSPKIKHLRGIALRRRGSVRVVRSSARSSRGVSVHRPTIRGDAVRSTSVLRGVPAGVRAPSRGRCGRRLLRGLNAAVVLLHPARVRRAGAVIRPVHRAEGSADADHRRPMARSPDRCAQG